MAHQAGKDQMGRSILKRGAIAVIVLLIIGGIGAAFSGGDDGEQTRSTPTAQPTRSTPSTTPTRSSTSSVQTVTASGTGTDVKIVRFGAGQYRCTFSVSDNWDTSFGSRIADNFIVNLETDGDWLELR